MYLSHSLDAHFHFGSRRHHNPNSKLLVGLELGVPHVFIIP